jgi:hypothetical protein
VNSRRPPMQLWQKTNIRRAPNRHPHGDATGTSGGTRPQRSARPSCHIGVGKHGEQGLPRLSGFAHWGRLCVEFGQAKRWPSRRPESS